jgi:hypothetical protein
VKIALLLLVVSLCAPFTNAQRLPILRDKPTPKFERNSFCPPEGLESNDHNDAELNRAKNRVDEPDRYFPVDFKEIRDLKIPNGVRKTKRSKWPEQTREAIAKWEGIPVRVEGFLALTDRSGRLVAGIPMGPELCNCQKKGSEFVDYHLWLVNRVGDKKVTSIVIEMTPRVRNDNPGWTIKNLNYIGVRRLPVRVSGWLMIDQEHAGHIKTGHRTNIWEVHPIMKFEYKEGGRWKDLKHGLS